MIIIAKEIGFVSIIDNSLPSGKQIVKSLSLVSVATAKYNTGVPSLVVFRDSRGKPTGSVNIDSNLQLQDSGGTPVNWVGTIDELIVKLNNEYFIEASGGGGGTSDTTAANQVANINKLEEIRSQQATLNEQELQTEKLNEIIDQKKEVNNEYYFNFSDIERPQNAIQFPLTCIIQAVPDAGFGETVPSATYADLDALITAFNNGITLYSIEKRSDDSFYILPANEEINQESELSIISFNTGIFTPRVFRFFRLNKGAYPAEEVNTDRTANELIQYSIGTGTNQSFDATLTAGESLVYYSYKKLSIDIKEITTGDTLSVSLLDGGFLSKDYPYTNFANELITGVELGSENRVSKIPVKVTNNSLNTIVYTVNITK